MLLVSAGRQWEALRGGLLDSTMDPCCFETANNTFLVSSKMLLVSAGRQWEALKVGLLDSTIDPCCFWALGPRTRLLIISS